MKQLLQDARTGELKVAEVPAPQLLPGCVLVQVMASLVSAGTERASAEFASKGLLAKAKARPDLVRDVLAKLRRDGLSSTMQTVRSRLDQPQSVGYSSSGLVVAVGDGVSDIGVGDRVACAGAGYAVHAEFACVPRMLVAKIGTKIGTKFGTNFGTRIGSKTPENAEGSSPVSYEEAAFGTVGAICLHGVRTAEVGLGDTVAVIGLGLLGQITVQLLKAAGCRVFGLDPVRERADLAIASGAEIACAGAREFRDLCFQKTGGVGVDSVLITAETPSSEPVNLAAELARDRAIVVAVGTVGMDLQRKLYYAKELDFRISRSYGPGRYDSAYEQKGRDYPIGQVRWTETRNLEAFLHFIAHGKLNLPSLITHRFPIEQAARAYDLITGSTREFFLGTLITYGDLPVYGQPSSPVPAEVQWPERISLSTVVPSSGAIGLGVLGAGNFAQSTLLPALKTIAGISFVGVCNATGPRSRSVAEKFGFSYCSNSEDELLRDANINAVLIASRHNLHAAQTLAALRAGKSVFCEKPLCLSEAELAEIIRAMSARPSYEESARATGALGLLPRQAAPLLMVGFNRRFAPMAIKMKKFLAEIHEPLAIHYRVNAGYIPADHWVNDPEQGGGRILGEVCHFVNLVSFLAGAYPLEVQAQILGNLSQYSMDNVVASLKFANGTLATISYMANGDKSASKERIEVFGGGSVAILDDFRRLELVRHGHKQIVRARWARDKGHKAEMQAFVKALRGKSPAPIPLEQVVGSTLATLRLQNSCQTGQPLTVDLSDFMASAMPIASDLP